MDVSALVAVGLRCRAIAAVGRARGAIQSAVRDVALTPALLDSLPASLGLIITDADSVRVAAAARSGASLKGADPQLAGSVERFAPGDTVLRGRSSSQDVLVSVLARGDFDADGWDDLLTEVTTGAVNGSFSAQQLWVLTRRAPGQPLRAVRRLW